MCAALTRLGSITAVGVILIGVLTSCGSGGATTKASNAADPADEFAGYVRSPVQDVAAVTLPSVAGTPVNMAAASGGLRIVYFGYTFCPDVCPTTMSDLRRALASLPKSKRDRVQVDMVTIDPTRDTGAKLTDYVTTFIADATAVRTDDQALLRSATRAFGANYRVTIAADGSEEVTHTGDLYAVDDTGKVVITWPFGTGSKNIGRDLGRLLAGERPPSN